MSAPQQIALFGAAAQPQLKPRHLLLSSLAVLRAQVDGNRRLRALSLWMRAALPTRNDLPVEVDPFLPNIVYVLEHRLTDRDWERYKLLCSAYTLPSTVNGGETNLSAEESMEIAEGMMAEVGVGSWVDLFDILGGIRE